MKNKQSIPLVSIEKKSFSELERKQQFLICSSPAILRELLLSTQNAKKPPTITKRGRRQSGIIRHEKFAKRWARPQRTAR